MALTGEALAQAQAQYRELRERKPALDKDSIDVILSGARSYYAWRSDPVPEDTLFVSP